MGLNTILEGFVKIQGISSRLKKEEILKKLIKSDGRLLRDVLSHTFDPFRNYRVTLDEKKFKFEKNPEFSLKRSEIGLWVVLTSFLDDCSENKISGNKAKDILTRIVNNVPPVYRYWIMRIVNRDLKIGLSSRTVQKFLPELLPHVEPMRCAVLDIKDRDQDFTKYAGYFIEPKFDGLRAYIVVDDSGKLTILSRKGKTMWNCDAILDEVRKLKLKGQVFDGEIDSSNWNKTISTVHTQSKKSSSDLKFQIFDIVPLSEWKTRKGHTILRERKSRLLKILSSRKFKTLRNTSNALVPTEPTVKDMKRYLKKYLSNGFEGMVLKNPKSVYSWKRSKDWLKVKPVYEDDFKIVAFKEGTGKHRGTLGAIFVQGKTKWKKDKWKVYSRVGSGFSDKQRRKIWKHRDKFLGKTVQIEFQEVSEKENRKQKGAHALRFPVFVRLRSDKD